MGRSLPVKAKSHWHQDSWRPPFSPGVQIGSGQQSSCRDGELAGCNSISLLLNSCQPHNSAPNGQTLFTQGRGTGAGPVTMGVQPQSNTHAQLQTPLPMASSLAGKGSRHSCICLSEQTCPCGTQALLSPLLKLCPGFCRCLKVAPCWS